MITRHEELRGAKGKTVTLTPEWTAHRVPFERFNVDGSDLISLLFSGSALGEFSFDLDRVELTRRGATAKLDER